MAEPAVFAYKEAWNDIVEDSKVYLLTWNPKPRFYQYTSYGINDYNLQWKTMIKVLAQAYRCCLNFCFVPEVSDEGKLHTHGWFQLKDSVKYHKSFLPSLKRNGFVKISKARSTKWKTFKYHIKDLDVTRKYLTDVEVEHLPITHHNYDLYCKQLRVYEIMMKPINTKKQIKKANVLKLLAINDCLIDSSDEIK